MAGCSLMQQGGKRKYRGGTGMQQLNGIGAAYLPHARSHYQSNIGNQTGQVGPADSPSSLVANAGSFGTGNMATKGFNPLVVANDGSPSPFAGGRRRRSRRTRRGGEDPATCMTTCQSYTGEEYAKCFRECMGKDGGSRRRGCC